MADITYKFSPESNFIDSGIVQLSSLTNKGPRCLLTLPPNMLKRKFWFQTLNREVLGSSAVIEGYIVFEMGGKNVYRMRFRDTNAVGSSNDTVLMPSHGFANFVGSNLEVPGRDSLYICNGTAPFVVQPHYISCYADKAYIDVTGYRYSDPAGLDLFFAVQSEYPIGGGI